MLRACIGRSVIIAPLSVAWPASGSRMPAISRSSVVLPQPDGPSRVTNSPRSTDSETPSTAATASNRLRSPTSSSDTGCLRRGCLRCLLGLQDLAFEALDPGGPLGVDAVVVHLFHLRDVVGRDLLGRHVAAQRDVAVA